MEGISIGGVIGVITGLITVIGAIVKLTRYITELQFKVRHERIEVEKEHLEKQALDLKARNKELLDQISTAAKVGTAALLKKNEIDDHLLSLMQRMQAKGGSVYVPLRKNPLSEPLGLVFLSIQPAGQQAVTLRRKVVPVQSLAGRCLSLGQPFVSANPKQDPAHFQKADQVSGYRTDDMMSIPLRHDGKIVGVLQLLNKEGEEPFSEQDINRIEPSMGIIQEKVAEFTQIPDNLEILGITPERDARHATVICCDLTRSSVLFREMAASNAILHLNEYMEKLCDIALHYGATVDKYVGDGIILLFNGSRPLEEHAHNAVKAALGMVEAFEKLKKGWLMMGESVQSIFCRIAISTGPVHQTILGHPQYQSVTFLGQPYHVASNLCEVASRDRNTIVLDENTQKSIGDEFPLNALPKEKLGKASAFVQMAYEMKNV